MVESASAVFEIAALSDPHFGSLKRSRKRVFSSLTDKLQEYQDDLWGLETSVDLIAITGDLTNRATREEAKQMLEAFEPAMRRDIPVIVVLGNHDLYMAPESEPERVVEELRKGGIQIVRDEVEIFRKGAHMLGIAGSVGFSHDYHRYVLGNNRETEEPYCAEEEFAELVEDTRVSAEASLQSLAAMPVNKRALFVHHPVRLEPEGEAPTLGSVVNRHVEAGNLNLIISGHKHSNPVSAETDLIDLSGKVKMIQMHAGLPFRIIRI